MTSAHFLLCIMGEAMVATPENVCEVREINSIEESGQVLSVGAIQVQIGHGPCSPLSGSTWIFWGSKNNHPEMKIPDGVL